MVTKRKKRTGTSPGGPWVRRVPAGDLAWPVVVGMVAACFVLAGCARHDDVLARIRTQTITARDLRAAAVHASREGTDSATSEIRPLFDALVARALLLEAARDLRRSGELGASDSLPSNAPPARAERIERRLLEAVYRIEVLNRVADPDSVALRSAWSRRPRPHRLSAADVVTLSLSDSGRAMALGAAFRGTRDLAAAARLVSPPLETTNRALRFPTRDPLSQKLERMLATIPDHQIRGPLPVAHGWVFVELLNRKFRQSSFDEFPPADAESLRSEALERAREARFNAFMDSLTAIISPQIFSDRLDRVRLSKKTHSSALGLAWALTLAMVVGLGLRYTPRPGGKASAGLQRFGKVAIQTGLVGLLFLTGGRYLVREDWGGWDFANYHRAAVEMRAGMSPYDPKTVTQQGWDPATPFLYAPVTLWLFRPLCGLPLERAVVVWFWIEVGLALALGVLWWHLLSGRFPLPLFVAMALYGFNGALLIDLRAGNVSILEDLLLWSALAAFLSDRRWLCACLIAVAGQFKLLPILFLGLLIPPTGNCAARRGPILAGLGLFCLMLTLPNVAGLPWAHGYLHNLETTRPFGEPNPSALGLMDMVLARGSGDGGHSRLPLALWAVYCIALLMVSAGALRRAWRKRDPMEWIVIAVMLFILLSPRPIVYGYSLVLVPALLIVRRLWPRLPGTVVAVVALVAQGLILRGLMRADFIPGPLPWIVLVAISNLPFLMALSLWVAFVRVSGPTLNAGAGEEVPETAES